MILRAFKCSVIVACWFCIFRYSSHNSLWSIKFVLTSFIKSMKSSWDMPGNRITSDKPLFKSFGMLLTVWTQMITLILKCRSFFNNLLISVSFERSKGWEAKSSRINSIRSGYVFQFNSFNVEAIHFIPFWIVFGVLMGVVATKLVEIISKKISAGKGGVYE